MSACAEGWLCGVVRVRVCGGAGRVGWARVVSACLFVRGGGEGELGLKG